jgi:hypothetical protein
MSERLPTPTLLCGECGARVRVEAIDGEVAILDRNARDDGSYALMQGRLYEIVPDAQVIGGTERKVHKSFAHGVRFGTHASSCPRSLKPRPESLLPTRPNRRVP